MIQMGKLRPTGAGVLAQSRTSWLGPSHPGSGLWPLQPVAEAAFHPRPEWGAGNCAGTLVRALGVCWPCAWVSGRLARWALCAHGGLPLVCGDLSSAWARGRKLPTGQSDRLWGAAFNSFVPGFDLGLVTWPVCVIWASPAGRWGVGLGWGAGGLSAAAHTGVLAGSLGCQQARTPSPWGQAPTQGGVLPAPGVTLPLPRATSQSCPCPPRAPPCLLLAPTSQSEMPPERHLILSPKRS